MWEVLNSGHHILCHSESRKLVCSYNNSLVFKVWEQDDSGSFQERQELLLQRKPVSHTDAIRIAQDTLSCYVVNTGGLSSSRMSVRIRHAV